MNAQGPNATTPNAATITVTLIIPEVGRETKQLVLVVELDLLKPAVSG